MIYENVHVRNLANFDLLLARIFHLGNYYHPMRSTIRVEALSTVSHNARVSLSNVDILNEQYIEAVNQREQAFDALKKLNQRIAAVLEPLTGMNAMEMYLLTGCGHSPHSPFADQERYDFLLDSFRKIIHRLKVNDDYAPDAPDLKIMALENRFQTLNTLQKEVKRSYAVLCHAQAVRDEVLYRNGSGLVPLSSMVKQYIKYHFGWNSHLYKELADIPIRKER